MRPGPGGLPWTCDCADLAALRPNAADRIRPEAGRSPFGFSLIAAAYWIATIGNTGKARHARADGGPSLLCT
jgi:hypothetical protein